MHTTESSVSEDTPSAWMKLSVQLVAASVSQKLICYKRLLVSVKLLQMDPRDALPLAHRVEHRSEYAYTIHRLILRAAHGPLGSRVVSVLDSGAEGPGSNRSRDAVGVTVLVRQTVHTHCASVHQAAKLVAALLRVAGRGGNLAESNGSLPPGL